MKEKILNLFRKFLFIYKNKKRKDRKVYKHIDFKEVKNTSIKEVNRIIIVIPGMVKYSGGHTSILRLGTQLANEYEVIYASYITEDIVDMKEAAVFNLENYKGEILNLTDIITTENDILIATFWESVYFIKNLKGYKMYFVQDYEPYFYEYGEDYILAENTYKLGLHVVSLGKWNVEKIKKLTDYKNTILDYIDFPYEKKEYIKISRDYNTYKEIKKIKLCVYVKATLKRAPYLIDTMLGHLKLKLKNEKGINLEITYFGNESYLKLENGQSLGKLDKKSLMELYHNSDFGMCASLTNISLVPYEMLATGLPLIEFEEGSFKDFFPEETAIITDFNYETLYRKLLMVLSDPEILEQRNNIAFKIMKELSWDNSGKQFISIIKKKVLK